MFCRFRAVAAKEQEKAQEKKAEEARQAAAAAAAKELIAAPVAPVQAPAVSAAAPPQPDQAPAGAPAANPETASGAGSAAAAPANGVQASQPGGQPQPDEAAEAAAHPDASVRREWKVLYVQERSEHDKEVTPLGPPWFWCCQAVHVQGMQAPTSYGRIAHSGVCTMACLRLSSDAHARMAVTAAHAYRNSR